MDLINKNNTATILQPKLSDGSLLECKSCSCNVFSENFLLVRMSKLLTGAAKDSLTPIPVIICKNCGEILDESLPNEVKQMLKNDSE